MAKRKAGDGAGGKSGGRRRALRSHAWFGKLDRDGLAHRSLDEEPGPAASSVRRPAGDRHLQHLVRADAVQRPFPRSGRACEARRLRDGRLPAGIPRHESGRDLDAAHHHAVPQSGFDGCRGIDPRQPARRRGAADRLRQDHAVADDGRGQLRSADLGRVRRADAERAFPRRAGRIGHACVEIHRHAEDRRDEAGRFARSRSRHVALGRLVHDHGNRIHHGLDGRSAGHGAADQRRHPRRRFAPPHAVAHGRQAHRRDGAGGSAHVEDPDQAGFRERHHGQCRDRRLDQRGGASAGAGRAHGHQAVARRLGSHRSRRAVPGQSDAVGQISDGGFLLRRRPARRAARDRPAAAQEGADRQRPDHLGQRQGRQVLEPRRDLRAGEAVQETGWHRGPARQSRARGRGAEAVRRDAHR